MKNKKQKLVVHKVHRKNNGGYTVGMVSRTTNAFGMQMTNYMFVKFEKKPTLGQEIDVMKVETRVNKDGFAWITEVE